MREIEPSGDVEPLNRYPVVQEHQKVDLGRPKVYRCRFEVGFKLNALQLQTVQVYPGEIAGSKTPAIHSEFAVPVVQVLSCVLQYGLRLQDLDISISQVKHQTALLVQIGRFRDGGGLPGLITPQLPLVLTFVQVANAG